jgi:putative cell wall-binding protein
MKRLAMLFVVLIAALLLIAPSVLAQDNSTQAAVKQEAAKPPAVREKTLAEYKLELAQKDAQIADLKVQLYHVQSQFIQVLGNEAEGDKAAALKAVQDATPKLAAADRPEPAKAEGAPKPQAKAGLAKKD